MANTSAALLTRFNRTLEEFKKNLSQDEREDFSLTTLEDLKQTIHEIQHDQAASRRMKNLNRLAPFLEAMEQYDKIVQVFLNASNLVAFIWGPVKFLLQTANTYVEAFNALLEAYQDIGENLPLLAQYEQVFHDKQAMQQVLGLIYTDIIEFHRSAMRYFRGPVWKQMFQAMWKTFRTKFNATLVNLQRHKQLLENQANLFHFEQYQEDRIKTAASFERIREESEQRHRLAVAAWLSGADSAADQQRASSIRAGYPQSGRWLLEEHQIKKWMDPSRLVSQQLWVNGKPGAGKTVLASLLVEECQKMPSARVVYFYSKHGDPKRNNLIVILRSILAQLLQIKPMLASYVFETASNCGRNSLDDQGLASKILDVVLATFDDTVYVIIDGLDECPKSEKAHITRFMSSLITSSNESKPGALRCCFVSQDDNDIGELLKTIPVLAITSKHNKDDISAYCRAEGQAIQMQFDISDDEKQALVDDISARADGMFIFATLVMKNLLSQVSKKRLRKELKEIPSDLDHVYERIVHRILYEAEPAESRAAKRLLSWLVCAIRPLRWHEIQGAASYDPEDHSFDLEEGKIRKDPKKLCGSLIDLHADAEIRLVHLTAKLYLERHIIQIYEQEMDLFCLCLGYLQLPAFDKGLNEDSVKDFVLQGHYAFMDYALAGWPVHLQRILQSSQFAKSTKLDELSGKLQSFFHRHPTTKAPTLRNDKLITLMLQPFHKEEFFEMLVQSMTIASEMGYITRQENQPFEQAPLQLVLQVSQIRSVIEKTEIGCSLAQRAQLRELYGSQLFKCPRVRCHFFYDGFDDQRERDKHLAEHERPYLCAYPGCPLALIGYATANQLRKHETDYHYEATDPSSFPWHPKPASIDVYKELRNGNSEAFDLWLDQFDGRIPLEEFWAKGKCRGPLRAAIETENPAIKLDTVLDLAGPKLLQRPKNDNSPGAKRILSAALKSRNDLAVGVILTRAKSLRDTDLFGLFDYALSLGLDTSAMTIIKHRNCLLRRPERLASYLSASIRHGRLSIVRYFLEEKGADPNMNASNGLTALGTAARYDQTEIARILLDMNECDKWAKSAGRTPAEIANENGNIEFLLHCFPGPSAQTQENDWFWITQLLIAARDGDAVKVQDIVNQDGRLPVSYDIGSTPLVLAVEGNHISTVEHLLQSGKVPMNASTRAGPYYECPLSIAIMEENISIVRLLLGNLDSETIAFDRPVIEGISTTYIDFAKACGNTTIIKLLEDEVGAAQQAIGDADQAREEAEQARYDNTSLTPDRAVIDSNSFLEGPDWDFFLHGN